MRSFNILLTCSSNKTHILDWIKNSVEKLRSNSRIFAGDSNKNVSSKYFCDQFWHMPKCKSENFNKILNYCKKNKIKIIIPSSDKELVFWSKFKTKFEKEKIFVMVSETQTIEVCLDKLSFYKKFKKFGSVIFTTQNVNNFKNTDILIAKRRVGSGSKKNKTGLKKNFLNNKKFIYQKFIKSNNEVSIDCFFSKNFDLLKVVPRLRTRVENGESSITTVFESKLIYREIRKIGSMLNFSGHVMFQGFFDNNKIRIFECNPRIGGASVTSFYNNMDSIYLFILENIFKKKIDKLDKKVSSKSKIFICKKWFSNSLKTDFLPYKKVFFEKNNGNKKKLDFHFRTNCSEKVGMGHISRTLKLANKFKKKGHNCYFYFDRLKNIQNLEINFPAFELEKNYFFKNDKEDAKKFLSKINKEKDYVVLDDYRMGDTWKKLIKNKKKLISISDSTQLDKYSDFVINFKINSYKIKYLNGYKSNKTKYLLGPKYALLESEKKTKNYSNNKFNIVVYLGGSGKFNIFSGLVESIKKKFNSHNSNIHNIKVILGPLFKDAEKVINKYKNVKNVTIIYKDYNLINIYKKSQLFVGSAGTSLYETSYSNIPSILFKYADNQDDKIEELELLGHYFHLNKKEFLDFDKVADLCFIIFKNYNNIKKIVLSKKISLDSSGPDRIYNAIFNKKITNYSDPFVLSKKSKPKFGKIRYDLINKAIKLRNETQKRLVDSNKKKIKNIDHYLLWFKSNN